MNEGPETTFEMLKYLLMVAGGLLTILSIRIFSDIKKVTRYDLDEIFKMLNDDIEEKYARMIVRIRKESDFLLSLSIVLAFWFLFSIIFY